ncbi:acetylornithine/succinyldiaminopimelate/putrescine aminotransferase [Saccharothrix tamanrassetensis]|uniref:Acetylornithine/succinyldiaminopimelate/putresci ne aminotransferase n=1 Tax=Saccharothrix tamanrassetensis TaxID=1051531 RepID=A0A841CDQ1_9PSEU|nr:aminotransferase class III-fold pyridoxal phosphate-dependent enzyme [Saccharothrix tamanrassetensis]MBB5953886.1 acetylornithine/succinyldiaminopimelate/putrescine aminotransferase [Saccharothrix tamanrassetensis]
MSTATAEFELAEPMMLQWLTALGVDVEFVRGEGNTLYFVGPDGAEVPVLDYAGGYGSLILGHNHPGIVGAAREFLDAGTPVLAQASRQTAASRVATALNTVLRREFGVDEPYFAVFSNSGAESIEVALKHAEFDRVLKVKALADGITEHLGAARAALADGTAVLPDAVAAALGLAPGSGIDAVAAEVGGRVAALAARPSLFITLAGGFHGKLVGSVQLTHNPAFRTPFATMAPQARFVPLDRLDALDEVIAQERATVPDLVVDDGVVTVVERDFPVFSAFVLEAIQGEGGIRVVDRAAADRIKAACAAVDCPVVVDEIQSGMGRTGAFFAGSLIGLVPDYVTLAKGLGGGIAKAAVTLVRGGRYRPEFELVHSSTFAKDTFSSTLALTTLELLEADGGAAYRRAADLGERLTALFTALRADFPDVVKDVRGKGLMLGLEFHDQSASAAPSIAQAALTDTFGYAVAGYLFRVHRIRTFPTASATTTLRFEPSVLLTDAEIARLDTALRALAAVLRDQDEEAFTAG